MSAKALVSPRASLGNDNQVVSLHQYYAVLIENKGRMNDRRNHAPVKGKSQLLTKRFYSYILALCCFCCCIVPYVGYQIFLTHRSIQARKEAIVGQRHASLPNTILASLIPNQAPTEEVLRKIKSSSVQIYNHSYSSSGSGVIIDKTKGWILTNKHVIERTTGFQVMVNTNPRESKKAKVVYKASHYDLAILEVPGGLCEFANLEAVTYARQPYIVKNMHAISFGYGHREPAFHQYRVKKSAILEPLFETDGLMWHELIYLLNDYIGNGQPGQSGSGMFTMNGDLIGLLVGGAQKDNMVQTVVIPIDQIRYVIDFFHQKYQPGKCLLGDRSGIHVGQVPLHCMEELEETKLSMAQDWLQKHIAANGMQSRHSLNALIVVSSQQENLCFLDVILEVNGTPVDTIASFYATLRREKGDSVQLKILRGNYLIDTTVAKELPINIS